RDLLIHYPFPEDRAELTADFQTLRREDETALIPRSWGLPWTENLWWVGEDGAGGFFFIDCAESPTRIYHWDHADAAVDCADRESMSPRSVLEAVEDIRQADRDDEAWRQHRLEQIANRRWWQFWIPKRPPRWLLKRADLTSPPASPP